MRQPAIVSLLVLCLVLGCHDGGGPLALVPGVTGTVTSSTTGRPVAGAAVRVGDAATTTGADGRFELADLTEGTASLHCTAPGFADFDADITITSGSLTRDIGLARVEVFELGDYALWLN